MFSAFRVLAALKGLRGTPLDPFGRTGERRLQRALIGEYRALLDDLCAGLTPGNHAVAVDLASLPMDMRGFGHVFETNVTAARDKQSALMARFHDPAPRMAAE